MKTTLAILAMALLGACATTNTASGVKPYPLDTCIVTDNRLGSMGPVITRVYNNQEVKFCCPPCVREFEEDPDHFLSLLN